MRCVFLILCMFVFMGAADALQSCLALSTSTACKHSESENLGRVDWSATCLNGSYTIKGVAGCSIASSSFTRATTSEVMGEETNCFCKVFAPYESNWVYSRGLGSASDCYANCSYYCARAFAVGSDWTYNTSFRESIINVVK